MSKNIQIFALDVETTTGDPDTASIRELALVALDEHFYPTGACFVQRYSCLPSEQESGAFEVHGIPPESGADPGLLLKHVHEFIRPWTYDYNLYLLGHNIASFDVPVLRRALGSTYMFHYRLRCTLNFAMGLADAGVLPRFEGLTGLVRYFGMERSEKHSALEDCRLEAAVYRRLLEIAKEGLST